MTTYKGINGFAVQSVASDPSPLNEGQVWYNNTSYAFKLATFGSASWSSGGNMSNARNGGGSGTPTAAVAFAGNSPSTPPALTELYNGSSWTSSGNLNTGRAGASAGTQTSTLNVGGYTAPLGYSSLNEAFNGSSWTVKTNHPEANVPGGGLGIDTAFLRVGGYNGSTWTTTTSQWNGTAWTAGGSFSPTSASQIVGTAGTLTAGLKFGGAIPGSPLVAEAYNGSTWTASPSINTALGPTTGQGTQTSALMAGGYGGSPEVVLNNSESYNGTAWSTQPSFSTPRGYQYGQGRASNSPTGATAGLIFGGDAYPAAGNRNQTELFTGAAVTTKTITTS
jgi:hypothetical protein